MPCLGDAIARLVEKRGRPDRLIGLCAGCGVQIYPAQYLARCLDVLGRRVAFMVHGLLDALTILQPEGRQKRQGIFGTEQTLAIFVRIFQARREVGHSLLLHPGDALGVGQLQEP
jgi:hypothetical protein